jgi:hypothetical protein
MNCRARLDRERSGWVAAGTASRRGGKRDVAARRQAPGLRMQALIREWFECAPAKILEHVAGKSRLPHS